MMQGEECSSRFTPNPNLNVPFETFKKLKLTSLIQDKEKDTYIYCVASRNDSGKHHWNDTSQKFDINKSKIKSSLGNYIQPNLRCDSRHWKVSLICVLVIKPLSKSIFVKKEYIFL